MGAYLDRLDALPEAGRWAQVRSWIFAEPLPFFAELRSERPVLVLPEVTCLTRFADCSAVLRRHDHFTVELYEPKQGKYFMAQDDTAAHWREKSIMKTVLDFEDLPKIRQWVAERASTLLDEAEGEIEAVSGLSRAVPIALVQEWFGMSDADPGDLKDWSYWNQQDAFWNQPFDNVTGQDQAAIIKKREKANVQLAIYLAKLIGKRYLREKLWIHADDVVSRLIRLANSGATRFSLRDVIFNVGGLLIGAVETTSHVVINALDHILSNPSIRAQATAAAKSDDVTAFDPIVFEALRFRPAFPYFFRTCRKATPFALGTPHETTVPVGTTVLAITHSAMFDPAGFPHADTFDPTRELGDTFTFGIGMHECLGRAVSRVMVPEIVRQVLRRDGIAAAARPDFKGTSVPEHWMLTYAA